MATTARARELRKNQTEAERALWLQVRSRRFEGHKFRRQQPIGPYVVDFVCLEEKLVVELDGGHHSELVASDADRDAWLRSRGFRVLRFWNTQVLGETDAVKQAILQALTPSP